MPNPLHLCKLSALLRNWPQGPSLNPLSILKTCADAILFPSYLFLYWLLFYLFVAPFHILANTSVLDYCRFILFSVSSLVRPFANKELLVNVYVKQVCYKTTSGNCRVPLGVCGHWWCASVTSAIAGTPQYWTVHPIACCLSLVVFLLRK